MNKVSKEELEELKSYRDGYVEVGPLELEFLKNLGYTLTTPTPDEESEDVIATTKDGSEFMTATQAYCYERYAALKKKICEKLGLPIYIQLDIEYMLSTYFVHF